MQTRPEAASKREGKEKTSEITLGPAFEAPVNVSVATTKLQWDVSKEPRDMTSCGTPAGGREGGRHLEAQELPSHLLFSLSYDATQSGSFYGDSCRPAPHQRAHMDHKPQVGHPLSQRFASQISADRWGGG